jgi:hypothetical protein
MIRRKIIEYSGPEDIEKFIFIVATHFPDVRPEEWEKLKCENCLDFKRADCEGEHLKEDDVLLCMKEKINNTIIEVHCGLVSLN